MLKLQISTYDSYTIHHLSIPCVRLVITNEDNFILDEGFLIPFRKYCFQVSTNLAIGDDARSSPVIEYQKILNNVPREEVRHLLHGQMVVAIERWLLRERSLIKIRLGIEEEVNRTAIIYTPGYMVSERSTIDKFIDDCYEWIFN